MIIVTVLPLLLKARGEVYLSEKTASMFKEIAEVVLVYF